MKGKDWALLGLAGLVGYYLYSKVSEAEESWLPSIDLSGIFGGLKFPDITIPDITIPEVSIPDLGDLLNLGGLGGGLDLGDLGLGLTAGVDLGQAIKDALGLGGGKGEGETEVTIAPEPSALSAGDVVKGFVSEHPIFTGIIGTLLTGAGAYGAYQFTPHLARGAGAVGRGIAAVTKDVYSVVKLPKGISIWKGAKAVTTRAAPSAGARIGIGGALKMVGLGGLIVTGAATISDVFARTMGIEKYIGQSAIEWLSVWPKTIAAAGVTPRVISPGYVPLREQIAAPKATWPEYYNVELAGERPTSGKIQKKRIPVSGYEEAFKHPYSMV